MTEQEIISRCRRGDRDAFNELITMYQKQVFNIAYGMLSDYEDAADASQEVFVNVFRSIASFKGNSSFSTWLYRICTNVCNDTLRKRRRRGMTLSLDADKDESGGLFDDLRSEAPTPEESAEATETQMAVRTAIMSLDKEHREVIIYADMQQLSYDEIAQILKCPKGTVKSRLNRARAALRKKLSAQRELF